MQFFIIFTVTNFVHLLNKIQTVYVCVSVCHQGTSHTLHPLLKSKCMERKLTTRQTWWWRRRLWGILETSSAQAAGPSHPFCSNPSRKCPASCQNLQSRDKWGEIPQFLYSKACWEAKQNMKLIGLSLHKAYWLIGKRIWVWISQTAMFIWTGWI